MIRSAISIFFASPFILAYGLWYLYTAAQLLSEEDNRKLLVVVSGVFLPLSVFLFIGFNPTIYIGDTCMGIYLIALIVATLAMLKARIFPPFFMDKFIVSLLFIIPSALVFIGLLPPALEFYGIIK